MLNTIKELIGLTDNTKDSLLQILIDQAKEEILNYTKNEECIKYMDSVICQIVAYKYSRLKTAGVTAENYSGVSYTYTADYPESIMRQIRPFRKVIFR